MAGAYVEDDEYYPGVGGLGTISPLSDYRPRRRIARRPIGFCLSPEHEAEWAAADKQEARSS